MDNGPGVSLFQGTNINIENALQNQEEAEDIEDQIRRQEEIQNLLIKEMDDFNYDESSINSSANISIDETDQHGLMQKYRETSMNSQLKVLYEVRVREILTLKKQLEDVESQFEQYKKDSKRQLLLLEADKDKLSISYKQAQDILVDKTEELMRLIQGIEGKKSEITQLNCDMANLKSDNNALQRANEELQMKLSISKEAFSTNTITDRNILEQHQAELHRINVSLDSALAKLDRKEKENKELEQKLREMTRDKDELIIEKSAVINKLTAHLDSAQTQSQELLEVIEKLSLENQNLKKTAENKSTNDSTNVLDLLEKSEFIKGLQKQLEKTQIAHQKQTTEFTTFKESHTMLQKEYDAKVADMKKYQDEIKLMANANNKLQDDLSMQAEEIGLLRQKIDELGYIQSEKEAYDKRVRELEKILMEVKDKSLHDNGMQVSGILGDREELEKMEKELNLAYHDIEQLNMKLNEAKEEINSLSAQITLSEERDHLLKTLQEKAAHFEKVILEKQNTKEKTTRGVMTDSMPDNSELLAAKYEAEIIKKEIEIRKSIKNEFDNKFEKTKQELLQYKKKADEKCNKCITLQMNLQEYEIILKKMKDELKKTKQQRQEDRESIAKLLDVWKEKFYVIEVQNQELNAKYLKVKNYCDELIKQIKQREDEEKKLIEMIKNEAEAAVQYWHKQAVLHAIAATEASKSKIKEAGVKFEVYSKKADKEIEFIELEFQRKKKILESKLKKYS